MTYLIITDMLLTYLIITNAWKIPCISDLPNYDSRGRIVGCILTPYVVAITSPTGDMAPTDRDHVIPNSGFTNYIVFGLKQMFCKSSNFVLRNDGNNIKRVFSFKVSVLMF